RCKSMPSHRYWPDVSQIPDRKISHGVQSERINTKERLAHQTTILPATRYTPPEKMSGTEGLTLCPGLLIFSGLTQSQLPMIQTLSSEPAIQIQSFSVILPF